MKYYNNKKIVNKQIHFRYFLIDVLSYVSSTSQNGKITQLIVTFIKITYRYQD